MKTVSSRQASNVYVERPVEVPKQFTFVLLYGEDRRSASEVLCNCSNLCCGLCFLQTFDSMRNLKCVCEPKYESLINKVKRMLLNKKNKQEMNREYARVKIC